MKRAFYLLSVLFFMFSCSQVQKPTANELFSNWTKQVVPLKSFEISWTYNFKPLMSNDTGQVQVSAIVQKDNQDTVWGAQILTHRKRDSSFGIYFRNQGYVYSPRDSVITEYPPKYAKYAVTGYGSSIYTFMLEPNKLGDALKDSNNKITVIDTVFNGKKVWGLEIQYPDQEDITKYSETYYFDMGSNQMLGYSKQYYVIYDWVKVWLTVDKFDVNGLPADTVMRFFEDIQNKAKIKKLPIGDEGDDEFKLLPIGKPAPEITGTYYRTNEEFKLSEQNAKVYVIDFWYQSCRPCMEAVPYLVDMYNKYKDQGLLVLGVNSVDNTDKRRPYLKKFIEYKKMDYPVIMVNRAIDQMYKVPGYPTIYVLDKDKNVLGYEVGFDPDKKLDKIENIVKQQLQQ